MTRSIQPVGLRGSLRWIQCAVNEDEPRLLDKMILPNLNGAKTISWHSPLKADNFAEYRDRDFLDRIGAPSLANELKDFWPDRGPRWDALGCTDANDLLLIEAKAHIDEVFSPPTRASEISLKRIETALRETAAFLKAQPRGAWKDVFYQLANRLAHLYFLRQNGKKAWLVLVNFVGDEDIHGPSSKEEWEAACQVVWYVMGLRDRHLLSKYIVHIYPNVKRFMGQIYD